MVDRRLLVILSIVLVTEFSTAENRSCDFSKVEESICKEFKSNKSYLDEDQNRSRVTPNVLKTIDLFLSKDTTKIDKERKTTFNRYYQSNPINIENSKRLFLKLQREAATTLKESGLVSKDHIVKINELKFNIVDNEDPRYCHSFPGGTYDASTNTVHLCDRDANLNDLTIASILSHEICHSVSPKNISLNKFSIKSELRNFVYIPNNGLNNIKQYIKSGQLKSVTSTPPPASYVKFNSCIKEIQSKHPSEDLDKMDCSKLARDRAANKVTTPLDKKDRACKAASDEYNDEIFADICGAKVLSSFVATGQLKIKQARIYQFQPAVLATKCNPAYLSYRHPPTSIRHNLLLSNPELASLVSCNPTKPSKCNWGKEKSPNSWNQAIPQGGSR